MLTARINPTELVVGHAAHAGKTRKEMEDAHLFTLVAAPTEQGGTLALAIVADGIGGRAAGEEASRTLVESVSNYFRSNRPTGIPAAIQGSLDLANDAILTRARANPEMEGMGTTAVAAVITTGELYVGWLGDSRAYLLHSRTLKQLTRDHTWAQEAVESKHLTPEQAAVHPNRNVLRRYLGIQETVQVELAPVERFVPGDMLLLCTDGLTDLVQDNEIRDALARNTPQNAAERLKNLALKRGGHDNITALVVQAPDLSRPAPALLPFDMGTRRNLIIALLVVANLIVLALVGLGIRQLLARSPNNAPPTEPLEVAQPPAISFAPTRTIVVSSLNVPTVTSVPTYTPVPPPPGWTPVPFAQLGPIPGQTFLGPDAQIILEWNSTRTPLPADVFYVATIRKFVNEQQVLEFEFWTRQTRVLLGAELFDNTSARFDWFVTLKRQTGTNPDGSRVGAPLLPPTQTLHFFWLPLPPEPTPTETPRDRYQ